MEELDNGRLAHLIATRNAGMGTLYPRCWPGGLLDRRDPLGSEWLRRAGFRPALVTPARCGCAEGRCQICN